MPVVLLTATSAPSDFSEASISAVETASSRILRCASTCEVTFIANAIL
jgi:hypothetical protein